MAAIPLRIALEEMSHPQPRTPVVTDNSSAKGLIDKTVIPKRAKARDMIFNWLKCREAQQLFEFIWKKGKDNKDDYHTKNHAAVHRQDKRGDYLAAPAV